MDHGNNAFLSGTLENPTSQGLSQRSNGAWKTNVRRLYASLPLKALAWHVRGGDFTQAVDCPPRKRNVPERRTRIRVSQSDLRTWCAAARTREPYTHPGCSWSSFSRPSGPILGILISPPFAYRSKRPPPPLLCIRQWTSENPTAAGYVGTSRRPPHRVRNSFGTIATDRFHNSCEMLPRTLLRRLITQLSQVCGLQGLEETYTETSYYVYHFCTHLALEHPRQAIIQRVVFSS